MLTGNEFFIDAFTEAFHVCSVNKEFATKCERAVCVIFGEVVHLQYSDNMSRVSAWRAIRLADADDLIPMPTFSDFHICHNLPLAHSYDPFVVTPPTATPWFVSIDPLVLIH